MVSSINWNKGKFAGGLVDEKRKGFGLLDHLKMRGNYVIFADKDLSKEELDEDGEDIEIFDTNQSQYFNARIKGAEGDDEQNPDLMLITIQNKNFVISPEGVSEKFIGHPMLESTPLKANYFVLSSFEKRVIKQKVLDQEANFGSIMSGVAGLKHVEKGATKTALLSAFLGVFAVLLPAPWRPTLTEKKLVAPQNQGSLLSEPEENATIQRSEISEAEIQVGQSSSINSANPANNVLRADIKKRHAVALWLAGGLALAGLIVGALSTMVVAPSLILMILLPIAGFIIFPVLASLTVYLWKSGGLGRLLGSIALAQQKFGQWLYGNKQWGVGRWALYCVFFITSLITGALNIVAKIFNRKSPFDVIKIPNGKDDAGKTYTSLKIAKLAGTFVTYFGRFTAIGLVAAVGIIAFTGIATGGTIIAALPFLQAVSNIVFFYSADVGAMVLGTLMQWALISPVALGITLAASIVVMILLLYPTVREIWGMIMDLAFWISQKNKARRFKTGGNLPFDENKFNNNNVPDNNQNNETGLVEEMTIGITPGENKLAPGIEKNVNPMTEYENNTTLLREETEISNNTEVLPTYGFNNEGGEN